MYRYIRDYIGSRQIRTAGGLTTPYHCYELLVSILIKKYSCNLSRIICSEMIETVEISLNLPY